MADSLDVSALLARALAAGGIEFVTAFPGSPTTSLALYLEREGAQLGIEFRWAINENVALSQAFGAAMGGRGAAALMKHVGVNVASDALHAMGVVHGLAAPLLLVEGADAKPGSSQSAQDNRALYAGSPQLLVVSPTLGAEAEPEYARELAAAVADACTISTGAGMLVVLRGDARCFAAKPTGLAALPEAADAAGSAPSKPASAFAAWPGRGYALATSARTYAFHLEQRRLVLERLRPWIEAAQRSCTSAGEMPVAVVIAAHLGVDTAAVVAEFGLPYLRLQLEHPLPARSLRELAARCETLVVLEECTPTLEHALAALVAQAGLRTRVLGRSALGDARPIGRLRGRVLRDALGTLAAPAETLDMRERAPAAAPTPAELLADLAPQLEAQRAAHDEAHPPSNFSAGDLRRQLFACLRSLAPEVFIAVDPGVTGVLALAEHQCDVKMHMGGAVPMAAGWARARPGSADSLAVAVVGDTNLPHSEWLGILDAAHHGDELLVVIADNGHSEMTQRIVTPRPTPSQALASLRAVGVHCESCHASTEHEDWLETLRAVAAAQGPRLVWLHL